MLLPFHQTTSHTILQLVEFYDLTEPVIPKAEEIL